MYIIMTDYVFVCRWILTVDELCCSCIMCELSPSTEGGSPYLERRHEIGPASSMVFVRPADEAPFWGGGVGLDRRHTYHIDGSNDDPAGELCSRPSAWCWLPVRWPVDRASRRARIKGDTRASSVLLTSVELCSAVVKAGCGHNFVEHVLCSINSCV